MIYKLEMFGILEPISSEEITHSNHGLMIRPVGVAFDSNCHRIGTVKDFMNQYLKVYLLTLIP